MALRSLVRWLALAGIAGLPVVLAQAPPGPLTLAFVPNCGQDPGAVRYRAHGLRGQLAFLDDGVLLTADGDASGVPATVMLRFLGRGTAAHITGIGPRRGSFHFLRGRDPDQWRRHVPARDGVRYREIYPCTDLDYEGIEGRLKGTWTVRPGGDPHRIRWCFPGHNRPSLEGSGRLRLSVGAGLELVEEAPVAWQDGPAGRRRVAVRFHVNDDNGSIGFRLGAYDRRLPLVIDPVLRWCSLFGGGRGGQPSNLGIGTERAHDIAVDADGFIYVTGYAHSHHRLPEALPLRSTDGNEPLQSIYGGELGDAFVLKIDPRCVPPRIVFCTHLGGGRTWNFHDPAPIPGSHPPYPVMSPGGPIPTGKDAGLGIAVSPDGDIVIVGRTQSDDFPGTGPAAAAYGALPFQSRHADTLPPPYAGALTFDGFVARLAPDGARLLFATYLGASDVDEARAVAVDTNGDAYVLCNVATPFPLPRLSGTDPARRIPRGGPEAWVVKIDRGGRVLASTWIGGEAADWGMDLAIGPRGRVHVVGTTLSRTDLAPVSAAGGAPFQASYGGDTGTPFPSLSFLGYGCVAWGDAFLAILDSDLLEMRYLTYLDLGGAEGGTDDAACGVAVAPDGDVFICGVRHDQRQGADPFLLRLRPEGRGRDDLLAMVFPGGEANDIAFDVALGRDRVYVVGTTASSHTPVLRPIVVPVLDTACPFPGCARTGYAVPPPVTSYCGGIPGGGPDAFIAAFDLRLEPTFWTYLGGATQDQALAVAVQGPLVHVAGITHVGGDRGSYRAPDPPVHWPLCQGDLWNASTFLSSGYNGATFPCGGSADALLASILDDT